MSTFINYFVAYGPFALLYISASRLPASWLRRSWPSFVGKCGGGWKF